ncbi:hypothetical protein C8R47DRAFT_1230786 [Mycena vitilis]|nr:hypothetical protein C8R47DRAFT_1230786 [Mycena vitilis]
MHLTGLPTEIVDSIIDILANGIDENPWMLDSSPDTLETLRNCALVSRVLVRRCQTHIFCGITLRGGRSPISPARFSTLLTESPHLSSHVRGLELWYNTLTDESMAASLAHIFSSVIKVVCLVLRPLYGHPRFGPLRDALRRAFALPRLRHLSLFAFELRDALEIQEFLGECTSLKSMTMKMMSNRDLDDSIDLVQPAKERLPFGSPHVVLETLQLFFFKKEQVQMLLDAFTVIDITQLHWLCLYCTPLDPLVPRNVATIRRLGMAPCFDETLPSAPLTTIHTLQTLDLRALSLPDLNMRLRDLGDPRHLNHLRTVSIQFIWDGKRPAGQWQKLDTFLNDAPALEEVEIYVKSKDYPVFPRLEFMPALARRGVLCIRDMPPAGYSLDTFDTYPPV